MTEQSHIHGPSDAPTRTVVLDHEDPLLRPFIEFQARVVHDVLAEVRGEGRPATEVVALVAAVVEADAEENAQKMSERVSGGRRLPLACTEGCSHCCRASVVRASTPEILRIASWLREHRTAEELALLQQRATEVSEAIVALDANERAKAKVACPLLDLETGRCTVYDVRPVPCRAYHSGSVEACKRALDEGEANPVLPIDPTLFNVAHAHAFGMMTTLVSEGLDVGPYDLAATLPRALETSLDERWLAGEKVLAHTRLSAAGAPAYDVVLHQLASDLRGGGLNAVERIARRIDPEERRKERNRRKRAKQKR